MKRKIIFTIFLFPILLLSTAVKIYHISGYPLRIKKTEKGIFVIDSLGGVIYFIHEDKKEAIKGFSFPLWVDTAGDALYVTDVKGECVYKIELSSLEIIDKVYIKRPEMIKAYRGRIYISSGNEIYELDKNLEILRKWKFCAKSVYFYFYGDYLLHMNYWKAKGSPAVTIINLRSGKVVKNLYLGFERPLRFLSICNKWIFLDYKTGDIAFVRNFHVVKRIDLPSYSYDIVHYQNKIVVSNLFEKFLYIIDPATYKVSKMRLDCQVGDLESLNDHLFLSCIFDNYVCSISNWDLERKVPCKYPVMMTKDENGVYLLCTDERKVKFISVGGKIVKKEGP